MALTLPPAPAKPRPMPRGDLTTEEQACARGALRFLATRAGGQERLAKALRIDVQAIRRQGGRRPLTAALAVRLARFARVPVDDVLSGRFPAPGSCPRPSLLMI